ncbi:ABC transporter permease [Pseudorhodoplanes sp.]|uniref:ABC transporter permease n=1 Tax=Pseudorhodoplanes sp. TaxID=1934341 RepID=UPI002CC7B8ED|nr:ABC transporter permease [Pseudorhodoplanes sp.]HWV54685.1 ABC transporter permease [Pseudorhodoplanes sp.]
MTAKTRLSELAIGMIPILLLLGLWQYLTAFKIAPPGLLPPPGVVFARFFQLLGDPTFLGHAAITMYRLVWGFGLAVVVGVGLGILGAGSRVAGSLLRPVIRVLAPVPKVALYPAFMLTLGFDHASKIALVFADALFPILLATLQGALAVEPKLVWSARAMGVSKLKCLFTVVLTAALPSILTGCRIGLVISCIVVFLSEMISSTDGLGYLLVRAARSFQTVDMFVPIIAISVLGLLLNAGFNALRARLLRGFPEEN